MDITIRGRNMTLSPSLKTMLIAKIRTLKKYLNRIQYIDVVVEKKQNHFHNVQLKIGIPGRGQLVVHESCRGLIETFDLLRTKAENVLANQNGKRKRFQKINNYLIQPKI